MKNQNTQENGSQKDVMDRDFSKGNIKPLSDKEFIKRIIMAFSSKTLCNTQFNNCPCNTCFHAISEDIDFKHICWLLILGLRGDYQDSRIDIIEMIKGELGK